MRSILVLVLSALALAATPAAACRVGGSSIFWRKPEAAPVDGMHSSVVWVRLLASLPGPAIFKLKPEPGRGYLVGTAQVQRRLHGPAGPKTIKVYLGTLTDCSNFARGGGPREVEASGYLVGEIFRDRQGSYFAATEEFQADPPPDSEPF